MGTHQTSPRKGNFASYKLSKHHSLVLVAIALTFAEAWHELAPLLDT